MCCFLWFAKSGQPPKKTLRLTKDGRRVKLTRGSDSRQRYTAITLLRAVEIFKGAVVLGEPVVDDHGVQ